MKLNIGSGQLIFDDCINIDLEIATSALGRKTNVVGTALSLPFKNNSFERVALIHCLEHFDKYDGLIVLEEIFRVLKPNCKVMIESPDLYKVFMEYSDRPDLLAWMLYGDLRETTKHPAMIHRWGYTAESAKLKMSRIGFTNIKWGDGAVHKRPNRDFQIWGTKPSETK
jgi:ubiquinone/menaquinone biosynthesis C-methylase UbiE